MSAFTSSYKSVHDIVLPLFVHKYEHRVPQLSRQVFLVFFFWKLFLQTQSHSLIFYLAQVKGSCTKNSCRHSCMAGHCLGACWHRAMKSLLKPLPEYTLTQFSFPRKMGNGRPLVCHSDLHPSVGLGCNQGMHSGPESSHISGISLSILFAL